MAPTTTHGSGAGIDFGLIFFSSSESPFGRDRYRLVLESARFADRHSFSSVWIPERHFTRDGWLYPNPAVLQAALARETSRISLRAGSVVVPLHNPLRIAEEWAMVDNLSGGRVGLSFASGWHPNDFALAPENYEKRSEVMYAGIEQVRKLWRGEAVEVKGGDGKTVTLKTYPPPLQPELPFWLTAAGNPKTFAGAGRIGANLLTHMYNQSVDELAEKIRIYRDARAAQGLDPATGTVSVMLHTYVGPDAQTVRDQLQGPFCEYLKSASYLVNAIAYSRGQNVDLSTLSEQDLQDYLLFVFDRLVSQQRVLFGTPESCAPLVSQLYAAGVNEIACQMDFGVDIELVLQSLPYLNRLREASNASHTQERDETSDLEDGTTDPRVGSVLAPLQSNELDENREHRSTSTNFVGEVVLRSGLDTQVTEDRGQGRIENDRKKAEDGEQGRIENDGDKTEDGEQERTMEGGDETDTMNDGPYEGAEAREGGERKENWTNALTAAQQRCPQTLSISEFYDTLAARGIELSNSYRALTRLQRGDGEALGEVQLAPDLQQDAELYSIHPTLLDACFQVLIAALPETLLRSENALYLPVGMRSFQTHQRPGSTVWSSAHLSTTDLNAHILEGDIRILNERGELLVEAFGLQLQRSELTPPSVSSLSSPTAAITASSELENWLYTLHWEATALLPISAAGRTASWLIFVDNTGVGRQLATLLESYGQNCYLVEPAESYRQLTPQRYKLNPASSTDYKMLVQAVIQNEPPLRGILHLWSLNSTSDSSTTLTSLEADQVYGVESALHTLQALVTSASTSTRLWLITQGAQPVQESMTATMLSVLSVSQSPVWGLGKTCAMEHPELWGGLVDLDPLASPADSAQQLYSVLGSASHEDQLAFRSDQPYAARMVRSEPLPSLPLHIDPEGSYLITGGLWGLGVEIARWLTTKGARHLVLFGRSSLPARNTWDTLDPESRQGGQIVALRALEKLASSVTYASVDVSDEQHLTSFLHHYQQSNPPIRGVLHAASVWQNAQGETLVRPLANLTSEDLRAVFRPKVLGGWLLAQLFRDRKLDFFASFSSAASLFGSAAQGNYAAASEFLDVLASSQRADGQAALSIDWGAISEIGFGGTPEGIRVHEYWESHGIGRITPRDVLTALEVLLPQSLARIGVIKLDWSLLQQFYRQIAELPLLRSLLPSSSAENVRQPEQLASPLTTLRNATAEERTGLLLSYLREQVATVLRVPPDRLDIEQPLTTLGLDSLMAIELKNRIELDLGVRIPIVTFLQGPSIVQFSQQVLQQLAADLPPPTEVTIAEATVVPQQEVERQEVLSEHLQDERRVGSTLAIPLRNEEGRAQGEETEGSGRSEDAATRQSAQAREMFSAEPLVSLQLQQEQDDAEQLLSRLDQLSDQDVDSLLSSMLANAETAGQNGHELLNNKNGQSSQTLSSSDAVQLLARIDQLTDAEVDSLLTNLVQKEE